MLGKELLMGASLMKSATIKIRGYLERKETQINKRIKKAGDLIRSPTPIVSCKPLLFSPARYDKYQTTPPAKYHLKQDG